MGFHGTPCWYELCTQSAAAARKFYGPLLGWSFQDAGMEGFDYGLALKGDSMIAGLMEPDSPMPSFWLIYFAVDDCDAAVAKARGLGASLHREAADIPGTGRFAILADPQGAAFGLLQPEPGQEGGAFSLHSAGHGRWHELHSTDPVAGMGFYAALFGWRESTAMDMGADGKYQLFSHDGEDIGAVMGMVGMAGAPPHWLTYFGVTSVIAATAQITALGGQVLHGPVEVPGESWITMALDASGVAFAVVGPR